VHFKKNVTIKNINVKIIVTPAMFCLIQNNIV